MLGTPKFPGLRDHTKAVIEKLGSVQWFRAVGMSVSEDVRVVSSWYEALEQSMQEAWIDAFRVAGNRLRETIFANDRDRYHWLVFVNDAIKPLLRPVVYRQTMALVDEGILDYEAQHAIYGDLVLVCEEAEYSDIVEPGFFTQLGFWYYEGHFPCGWEGEYPEGRLIIY